MKVKRLLRKIFKVVAFFRVLLADHFTGKLRIIAFSVFDLIRAISEVLIPLILTGSFGLVIFDIGYKPFYSEQTILFKVHYVLLILSGIFFTLRYLLEFRKHIPVRTKVFNFLLVVLIFYLLSNVQEIPYLNPVREGAFTLKKILVYCGITFLFLIEVGDVLRFIYRRGVNPALLFVGSFAIVIVIGGFLLLLPNATVRGIHPADAFFTSVSAVCVTGLTVVDTATHFTIIGKIIILLLIQIGGFGIMTFAGMISYLVTGSVSFQNQLALGNMLSNDRLSNVITFVSRVVLVTTCFEVIGALLIYSSLEASHFETPWHRIFFSVFHSVSAFCNAGFSTVTNGLYENFLRFNYSLQWIIAFLIILGGTGFPVVFNVFTFLRIKITNFTRQFYGNETREVFTNILPASSKLALTTTAILLAVGFGAYFVFEYNATLVEHDSVYGKVTTSFFGSVTPRTAGFNTVDLTALSLPTVMVYLLLMWIGASPGSTGGGIKTTVAAVAFLNMRSIVLGRKRTEIHKKEISERSINRAFAIIMLSLLVLGIAVLLLSIQDSEKGLLKLAFEAFSAFSTVGLTLGVTPNLSLLGKFVIMGIMFIGRVGALTLLFAVIAKSETRYYRYPTEDIMF
jgi:trk system potassium uptake protein TrkH